MLLLTLLFGVAAAGDVNATAEDGRRVILHDDGTWEAAPEKAGAPQGELSCDAVVRVEGDKMTGDRFRVVEPIVVSDDNKTGLVMTLMRGKSMIWTVQAVGGKACIDDDDKMNVLFSDGSKMELTNASDFNCEARFTVYFGGVFGHKSQLEELQSKQVETVRVWTRGDYVQRDLKPGDAAALQAAFKCL